MKNTKRRILCALLAIMMIVGMLPIMTVSVSAATDNGRSFTADVYYETTSAIFEEMLTIEAELNVPTTMKSRAGIVLGNYQYPGATQQINFGIQWDKTAKVAYPRYYYQIGSVAYNFNFVYESDENGVATTTPIDLRRASGTYVHVALVVDESKYMVHCYIDGVRKSSIKFTDAANSGLENKDYSFTTNGVIMLGGDYRADNSHYFKGSLKNIKVYSDARTANEISADAAAFAADKTDTTLILAYDLTKTNFVDDLSSKGNDLIFNTRRLSRCLCSFHYRFNAQHQLTR